MAERAQQEASEALLTKELVTLVTTPSFLENRAFIGYVCKLLDLMVTKCTSCNLRPLFDILTGSLAREIELAPDETPGVLLNLAFDPEWNVDLDDFLALVSSAIGYLRFERFQQAVIKSSAVQACFRIMVFSYTRYEDTSSHLSPSDASSPGHDDAKQLTMMRSNMNQVLSDISALPEFAVAFPILSPFTSSLRRCLSSPQLQLQVMACIMLGNIARSDNACIEFVHTCQIHKPLTTILTDANDSQLLHAALGFLKNLALPMPNKLLIGEACLIGVLPRLWNMSALPQIQYSSISLARQLLTGTFENVRRVCYHLSDDRDSPAYSRTSLSILIALFRRTDAEPVKMEIARLFTAIVRVFYSTAMNDEDIERRRKQFFEYHPDVGRPISFMVSQKKWPVVRSEGWFVMALMARSVEGAICISDILHDIQVFQPLVELLTGKSMADSSPAGSPLNPGSDEPGSIGSLEGPNGTPGSQPSNTKQADMARIDRENAMILVSELLKQRGSEMATIRRTVFEDLLKGGGMMHLTYQEVLDLEKSQEEMAPRPPKLGLNMYDATEESVKELLG